VRTIHSNNTVSTSPARAADYDRLIKICFDNREADIGAFIRRHLATANIAKLHELLTLAEPEVSLPERVEKFLNVGLGRYHSMLASRQLEIGEIATFEVAVVIEGEIPKYSANEDFYYRLQLNKPHHSGWPFWIDLHNSGDQADRPYVAQGGGEALVQANMMGYSLDFWRAEPSGNFYHLRSLQDDWHQGDNVAPRKFLDFALHTGRVAEVVSIGSHFAKALGCDEQNTTLGFATRWHGLAGRNLYSWSQPSRSFFSRGAAVENDITTVATMPLSVTAFSPVVESLMSPVFELFGGMRFQSSVIEGIVQNVLGRRM
jgi:hypothetical protein